MNDWYEDRVQAAIRSAALSPAHDDLRIALAEEVARLRDSAELRFNV